MQVPKNFNQLFEEANALDLYKQLVLQLNKDFLLANVDLDFHEEVLPSSLKLMLHETVYKLIQEKFTEYLNLLYIIDVPEKDVKALNGDDILMLSEAVSFLILKREWQKWQSSSIPNLAAMIVLVFVLKTSLKIFDLKSGTQPSINNPKKPSHNE